MNQAPKLPLRIGAWRIDPLTGQLSQGDESVRLEARTLRLLLLLAERAGEVVSIDEMLDRVWAGVIVTPDSVYQAITSLRRVLGDDPKQPLYIATVPRLGYRLVAAVSQWTDEAGIAATLHGPGDTAAAVVAPPTSPRPQHTRIRFIAATAMALVVVGVLAFLAVDGTLRRGDEVAAVSKAAAAKPDPRTIGVVPFLDLTEGMHEEEFADGMTEELIDKISKLPGFMVPAPTASFYFKDKQVSVAEIGRTLGVAYLLDGSVRKAGDRVRVAARLVRADDGFVVWSESYDRPFGDILVVQDDIADEVKKALQASIDAAAAPSR